MKVRMMVLTLLLCLPVAGWAEVVLRIEWQVNGPGSELQALIKEGAALQGKINPGVRHELWRDEIHGANVNRMSLLVYFDDLEHYAKAIAKEESNEMWEKYLSRFPADKFPTTFTGLSDTLVGEGRSTAKGGESLAIVVFSLNGSATDLASRVDEARSIQAKVSPKASIALITGRVTGSSVGQAAVLIRYPSLVDWAEGSEKVQASKEWGEFLQKFPVDKYPVIFRGLSRAVNIN
jgi:hypothetical protein